MDYISVTEFAEKAGVTPQAIYKRIKTDLEPFTIEENGVKRINAEALSLFTDKQQVKKSVNEDFLQAEVARLTAEVEVKQQTIDRLNEQLIELNAKILDIMDRQTNQYQLLLAHQQTGFQQLINALNPPKEIKQNDSTLETGDKPVKKPSLIKRIFSKRQ